jgi:hypothetical protein
MKVFQLVEGHNFHVDWHFKFWVEKDEKLAQRSVPPIHCNRVAFRVDKLAEQNLLSKTQYSLCGSCRWDCDLQLSYSTFGTLLYKILEIINFKLVTGKTIWARAPPRRDVARRPTSVSAPRAVQGRPLAEARSSPGAAYRGRWNPPGARTPWTAPYRFGAHRGPPVRQWRPAVGATVEAGYHGHISSPAVVTPEPSHPYKCCAFSPPPAGIATPPRHLRHRRRAAPLPAFHDRATAHAPSLDPIGLLRATCCPGRALVIAGAEPPRPPPPVLAMRPRRRVLRPNSGHPQALGEHTVVPCRFPMAKALIASP